MKTWGRAARLMFGIGWETGPSLFATFVGVTILSSIGSLLFAFALRALVDGIYFHSSAEVTVGGSLCALSLLTVAAVPSVQRWALPRIRERSIMVMQRRILRLTAGAAGLAHFERADYWDRLQQLKRNFADLLMGIVNAFVGPLLVLQLLVTAVALARVQPLLLFLPLVGFPAAWLSRWSENLKRSGERRSAENRRAAEDLFMLAASAQSAKEIRIYDLRDELLTRHAALSRRVQRVMEPAEFAASGVSGIGWLIFAGAYLTAVLLTLRAASADRMSPGDVALILTLSTALVGAAGRLTDLLSTMLRAVTVAGHYQWLADQSSPAPLNAGPADKPRAVPARLERGFELEDVSFGYGGSDGLALRDVSLRLPAGTVVALVGENGAGKTTLVKLLSRMYTPSQGRILLDGTDLREFAVDAYRERLTAGFQDYACLELLVRESVGAGDLPRITDHDAVSGALGRASADFVDRLPAGLETQLGRSWEGGVDLSGGEWQKLALARAMMREKPFLVIYDEPTAALDPQTEYALFEQIAADMRKDRATGRVTLLVSHRFSTVRMADLIVVLSEGKIAEQGSHAALMASGGLYAELYGLQARAYSLTQ
jgi:ATP-binding cassette subfamily B protein